MTPNAPLPDSTQRPLSEKLAALIVSSAISSIFCQERGYLCTLKTIDPSERNPVRAVAVGPRELRKRRRRSLRPGEHRVAGPKRPRTSGERLPQR